MKKIITISREFGSGGRTIGKIVADQLGYAFYDKELIEKVAEKTGFSPSYIKERGEYSPSASAFSYSFMGRSHDGLSTDDYLFSVQRKIILDLAEKGDCVIVGRCADYILRDREDTMNVFIHADKKKRAERIVKVYGASPVKPEKRLDDKDKKRRVTYKSYTDRDWGDYHNYDISLDSGTIGLERCADIICQLARAE